MSMRKSEFSGDFEQNLAITGKIFWDSSPYVCENTWQNDSDWQSHTEGAIALDGEMRKALKKINKNFRPIHSISYSLDYRSK